MAKSLADQLLGAGLVDKQKARQVQHEKRKQSKQQRKGKNDGAPSADEEARARIAQQQADKAERDRQLNRERKAAEEARAARAQANQMLQQHRQPVGGDIPFNFTDQRINKIKRLFVSQREQEQLARGQLAICIDENQAYVAVPRTSAEKVAERFPEALIFLARPEDQQPDEDDPYKDFPIPDDLMW